jgi:hypothetical protein
MEDEIDYKGMKKEWFPLKPHERRMLETIDPLEPTPKGNTSPTLENLMKRGWVVHVRDCYINGRPTWLRKPEGSGKAPLGNGNIQHDVRESPTKQRVGHCFPLLRT